MFEWVSRNSPKAYEEWRPKYTLPRFETAREQLSVESEETEEYRELKEHVERNASKRIKDEDFSKGERKLIEEEEKRIVEEAEVSREKIVKIIVDPLALYLPYHHYGQRWGIYFRVNKMLSDFKNFINMLESAWPRSINIWEAWRIYVMTIFWHELAHHVLEDIASALEGARFTPPLHLHYPLLSSSIEERFCEYTAFSTARRLLTAPRGYWIPLLGPESAWHIDLDTRERVLSALYYHWGRDDPRSKYHPVVDPMVPRRVDGLWTVFWEAHELGVRAAKDLRDRVFCVTF